MLLRPFAKTGLFLSAFLLCLTSSNALWAQLNANFTVNTSGGCSPLAVTFTNTTTGASPAATYTWTFGNGNGVGPTGYTSSESAIYSTPQSYTASLTVNDGGLSSTNTVTITVYPKPTVGFTLTNAVGCLPLTTSFTSTSTPGAGTISNYFWDFGDGNTETTTLGQVSNTYNFAQTYSPGLTVTNSFGCTSTLSQPNAVTVYPPVSASFTADSTIFCSPPASVQFNNTSSGPGTLSYLWNFGDGTTSTSPNPSHSYTQKGLYTVTLTVASSDGCSATTVQNNYINVADFNLAVAEPLVTCSNTPAIFTDQTMPPPTGTPSWAFSDGGTASGISVSHSFPASGTYNVTLTDMFGSCVVSQTDQVIVRSGVNLTGFVVQMDSVCGAPALVSFVDTSSLSVKWVWHFTGNPNDTSTLRNPTFVYPADGTYTPTLTVTDGNGCSGTLSSTLPIMPPAALITPTETLGTSDSVCAIITVALNAVSADTLTQYLWTFGDGTTSTSPNPTHTYSEPGTYTIGLSFVTNHGCRGVSNQIPIVVYPKPQAAFMAPDTLICGNTGVEFINQSTGNASTYTWNYGNGVTLVNNGTPSYYSYGDSGTYTITLVAANPGCSDTAVRTQYIHVLPPFPNIKSLNTCDTTRGTVTFIDSATEASTWSWSFGDGTPPLNLTTAEDTLYHSYSHSGAYTVVLTCTSGSCTVSDTAKVFVLLKQHPELSSTASLICASSALPVQLTGLDTNYQSVANGTGTYYNISSWQYGDSSSFSGNGNGLGNTYTGSVGGLTSGKDSIRTVLESANFGCYDTSNYIPLKVVGPTAAFGTTTNVCYKTPILFTDSSSAGDSIPIVKWQWTFGDGSSLTRNTGDTATHLYAAPGTYSPTLTITDSMGCTSSTGTNYTNVLVNGPQANFYWTPSYLVPGNTATFYNSSTGGGGATYQWYFLSDGSTSNNPISVTHNYPVTTVDTVRLIATGTGGGTCVDTVIKAVPVENLNASFTYTTQYINSANCPPMVAYFISNSFAADSLSWNFGDGGTAEDNPKPSHTYTEPGIYLVTLTAYGAGGTNIVRQDSLTVKGPYAFLRTNIQQACIPQAVILSATASYASSYTWDFGDGTVINSNDTLQTHTYTTPGLYTPALILTDSTGCQGTFNPQTQILMDTLHVALPPSLPVCDSSEVLFTPSVLSFAADSLHQVLTYHWTFGTGNPADTANIPQPGFDFTQPGIYNVNVQVTSIPGCTSDDSTKVTVVNEIDLRLPGDTIICMGNSVPLTAQGATIYQWYPNSTLSHINNGSAVATPDSLTTYTVVGQDGFHCFADTTSITVAVADVPTVTLPGALTTIAGSAVTLTPNASANVLSYNWTPPDGLSCTSCANPAASPYAPATYVVTVTTANGCIAAASITIQLTCNEDAVYVPNAFTPNHDGINDIFYPRGKGIKTINNFQIYDRWGRPVYSRQNMPINEENVGWDGTYNGRDMPGDAYVFILEVTCDTGETFMKKGTIVLIR